MAAYTIEDIELIRKKSGISYKEAVALLDYHNGNVARALVDLERNGRLKQDVPYQAETKKDKKEEGFFAKMSRHRVLVRDDEKVLLNLPLILMGGLLLFAPHVVVVSSVLALVMGCKISFGQTDQSGEVDFSNMVKKAAHTVANTVEQVAKEFNAAKKDGDAKRPADDGEDDGPSYYSANPAAHRASYSSHSDIPTIQVPVQVESREGKVSVQQDENGGVNVTVE